MNDTEEKELIEGTANWSEEQVKALLKLPDIGKQVQEEAEHVALPGHEPTLDDYKVAIGQSFQAGPDFIDDVWGDGDTFVWNGSSWELG